MEYHLGDSIAIGSGGVEFKDKEKENPQVELDANRMSRMSGTENYDSDMELLDEAGNISSGLALKKHNDVLKYGKQLLKSRDAREVDKLLAKMLASTSSLALMSIAVSGDNSFISTLAKGASLRGL